MDQPAQDHIIEIEESKLVELYHENRSLKLNQDLLRIILESMDFGVMTQRMADMIPQKMGYEIGVLALINKKGDRLEMASVSQTMGSEALDFLEPSLDEISIRLDHAENLCVQAMISSDQLLTTSVYDIFRPIVSEETAEIVQQKMGVKNIIVNPIYLHGNPMGTFIVGMSKPTEAISQFEKTAIKQFTEGVGVAIENSKLFTDLRDTKENLYKAYENLKELHKLKDEFLSVASHELRTPMTIIKSYLWMLEEGKAGDLNDKQRQYVTKAADGTKRMIRLINEMLNVSQMEQGGMNFNIKKVDVCKTIEEVVSGFELKIDEKKLRMDVNSEQEKTFVYADEPKLREILVNMVSNAVKFTDHGGVTIQTADMGDFVKIAVKDTGRGITEEDQKRLFHKFGRLDNSYQTVAESSGTGLGLYIVKLYAEGMGGEVGVSSAGAGRGSEFWFTLPKKELDIKALNEKRRKPDEIPSIEEEVVETITQLKKD